jgi:hypothetical protein
MLRLSIIIYKVAMDLPLRNTTGSPRFSPSDSQISTATTVGILLWLSSSLWYKKQIYARDKNLFNWALFSTFSIFSSSALGRFFFESPYAAAARRNNFNELRHQRLLGRF